MAPRWNPSLPAPSARTRGSEAQVVRTAILIVGFMFLPAAAFCQEIECGATESEVLTALGPPRARGWSDELVILTYSDQSGSRSYLIDGQRGLQRVSRDGKTLKDCEEPEVEPPDAAPKPTQIVMPPMDLPASVRGRAVTVWVFVTEAGAVDSVRLEPPTPDRRYNESIISSARKWTFEPAHLDGQPVSAWFKLTWML